MKDLMEILKLAQRVARKDAEKTVAKDVRRIVERLVSVTAARTAARFVVRIVLLVVEIGKLVHIRIVLLLMATESLLKMFYPSMALVK